MRCNLFCDAPVVSGAAAKQRQHSIATIRAASIQGWLTIQGRHLKHTLLQHNSHARLLAEQLRPPHLHAANAHAQAAARTLAQRA